MRVLETVWPIHRWPVLEFYTPCKISATANARDFKFCTWVGHVKSESCDEWVFPKWTWLAWLLAKFHVKRSKDYLMLGSVVIHFGSTNLFCHMFNCKLDMVTEEKDLVESELVRISQRCLRVYQKLRSYLEFSNLNNTVKHKDTSNLLCFYKSLIVMISVEILYISLACKG